MHFSRNRFSPVALIRLCRTIRRLNPEVIQTWMYHADLIGGVAARLVGTRSVVWGIRNSFAALRELSLSARMAARICALMSRVIPSAIVCNSARAALRHQEIGYLRDKFVVIPNGFDLSRFAIDDSARQRVRREWGVGESEVLLGCVARWDLQKDHANLLHALAVLSSKHPNFRCVLVGAQMSVENRELAALVRGLPIADRLILAGSREDIPAVMNSLDLHVLPSAGEAFPNVVAEAMACGTPCVVTDVGDAALVVGDAGWVVPPRDSSALAKAMDAGISSIAVEGRGSLGERCRRRIAENFSLEKTVAAYESVWRQVAKGTVIVA
jgi:glycosyltransferase involved in cell wall biosynthesis